MFSVSGVMFQNFSFFFFFKIGTYIFWGMSKLMQSRIFFNSHFFYKLFTNTHVTPSSAREGTVGGVWEIALPGCSYTSTYDTGIVPLIRIFWKMYLKKSDTTFDLQI